MTITTASVTNDTCQFWALKSQCILIEAVGGRFGGTIIKTLLHRESETGRLCDLTKIS